MRNKFEIDYEGMGTCIEATIKLSGNRKIVVAAMNEKSNKIVQKIIKLIRKEITPAPNIDK